MGLTRPRYSQIYDTDYKQSVLVATTGDVGNLLATGNMTNTIDTVALSVGDRILVKDQIDAKQNGIYSVVTVGTGSNGTWSRALDANANDKVTSGLTVTVSAGSTNSAKTFKLSTLDPITVGTTPLTFVNPFVAAAGGANTHVQFNDAGLIGGSSAFTFNKFTNTLSVTGNISSTNLTGTLQTASQTNITSVGTLTGLTSSGFINTSGNVSAATVRAGQINTTGNVLSTGGVFNAVTVNGSQTVTATHNTLQANIRNGDTSTGYTKAQVAFGYAGADQYAHFIHTKHNAGGISLNTIDFYTSNGLASGGTLSTAIHGLTIEAGRIGVGGVTGPTANLHVSGNAIIGSIVSVGAISSTGFVNTTANISAATYTGGQVAVTGLINTAGNVLATSGVFNALTVNGSTTTNGNTYLNSSGFGYTIFGPANLDPTSGAANLALHYAAGRTIVGWNYSAGRGEFDIIAHRDGGNAGGVRICDWSTANVRIANVLMDINYSEGMTVYGNVNPSASNAYTLGSSTNWWTKVWSVAVNAQYADLAETYSSDQNYAPGTVLVFGGTYEVTASTKSHDPSIAGVVSTNPAYHMNAAAEGVAVALTGRVPTKVKGPVRKGDRLVASDIAGTAERLDMSKYQPGCIIGKSLENIADDSIQTIEVVVGRV